MGARAEKILLDFLEEVSMELKALNQKKKVVRRNRIILDDRLMQNTMVLTVDRAGGFCDIYCKRGEVGVFYYGFYRSSVSKAYFNHFLEMFEIFTTWNYKKNYLDLYALFNKLTIMSFVEHWEFSLFNNPSDTHIKPLKLGGHHLLFTCHDSSSVHLSIDEDNRVAFKRINERKKTIPNPSLEVRDYQEQSLILAPNSTEYQIIVEVITKVLDDRRYFDKEEQKEFEEYSREHVINLLDFPTISSFQETSQKTTSKIHFLQ